jgi:outer membrane protein|tara:strand:- start:109 stop:1350 length:1242 start_codon:yes stop_codon:yes gene_type:complete
MTRFIHFFFILYILTAGSAWSINFQNLTLDDAHKIASENNYELLYLLEEKNSRSSALQEYQAQYFPQINAGVIFPFYGRSSAINVDQLLFDFGKLSQRINAGKYLIRAQEYSHEGKKISILNEVTEKFYEVLKTKNHISGLESERETKNKQLKKSIAFLEAGRVSSLDVAEKNLNLSRIELELISKKGLLRKLEEEFFTLLGVQRPSEVNYVANLKYTKIDLNSEAIIDSYMMNMYEIKALEMSILSTKATISAIYRDFLPNIVARAAYRFEGKGVSSEDKDNDLIGGMGATWQIFNGGRTYYQIQSQRARLRAQMTKLNLLKQELSSKIRGSVIEAETSFFKIEVLEKSMKASEAHFKFMKNKYDSGELSEIKLLEAKNIKDKQEILYQNSVYDYIIKIARIEKATGLNITK